MTTTPGLLEYGGSNTPGFINNIGLDLTAGVFSIVDAQGAAISSDNPGWISVPSTTGGEMVCLEITTGGTFNDDSHGSSHLTNLGFGITETADWASDMPWFLWVVNEDDTAANAGFFISRSPYMYKTPAATYIHDKDAAAANDTQASIFGMWSDDAGKASKPVQLIGSFRMRWSTTTDDWTVRALDVVLDGVGWAALQRLTANNYSMPLGQNGAASGTFMTNNGGTGPVFSTNTFSYTLGLDGWVTCYFNLSGDGGTDGAGAVASQMSVPYVTAMTANRLNVVSITEVTNGQHWANTYIGGSLAEFEESTGSGSQNADFGHGGRQIVGSFRYKAF